ncbi:MAG TPA: hypothetical protein VF699_05960 [Caulobacteraceae bacterium]|jgi:hypothetical protein
MQIKSMIPVLCATFALAGVSAADAGERSKKNKNRPQHSQQMQNKSGSVAFGAGTAEANRRGAEASGVVGAGSMTSTTGARRDRCATTPQSTATYATGATYADRRTASAAGSTGGAATGSGNVSSSSGLDATATGGDKTWAADASLSGGSTANANQGTRPAGC